MCFAALCLSMGFNLLPAGLSAAEELSASTQRRSPFVQYLERAAESTVNIHTEKRQKSLDVVFSSGKGQKVNGMGTGIVFDERGYIVTNFHVVEDAEVLKVTLQDQSSYNGRVIDSDPREDLAIIKIDAPRPLKVMPLGTSSDLLLGEDVAAIGNPFGYELSVSRGVISHRCRPVIDVTETQSYRNLIQIDAAINPGNSGGPLMNADGELIGINVAIRANAQRIGFAIPVDEARRVVAQLISIERRDGNTHGITALDLKQGKDRKLQVHSVQPGSPGALAGLQSGDVIVRSGEVDVVDRVDLERSLLGRRAGEEVPLTIRRNSETQSLKLQLAALNNRSRTPTRPTTPTNQTAQAPLAQSPVPPQTPRQPSYSGSATVNSGGQESLTWKMLGVKLSPLSPNDASLKGMPYRGGMRVIEVMNHGPAAQNDLKVGDVLVGLNVYETISQENVDFVLSQSPAVNPLKFYIVRGGETLFGNFELNQITSR